MKICFATDVHYPNYINRIQKSSLKSFLDNQLYDYEISYYISTSSFDDLESYNDNNNIKIFDINELRSENICSLNFELLPSNPNGIYPSKYPWNIRRFIIEKAAKDGFNYIIYVDADTLINEYVHSSIIFDEIKSKFENNTIKTNCSIFEYTEESTAEHFQKHTEYKSELNLNFESKFFNTLDKPCMVFMSEDSNNIVSLVKTWHEITEFGYHRENGYGNNIHGNLSFVIPMSDFKLKFDNFPFFPNHMVEDRYTYVKEDSLIIEYNDRLIVNKTITDLYKENNNKKHYLGYGEIYDCYLSKFKNNEYTIFEIGDLESLNVLSDFFVSSNFYGIISEDNEIINKPNIKKLLLNPIDFKKSHEFFKEIKINIIIDSSNNDINVKTLSFQNFYNFLEDDGYYFIEGVNEFDVIINYLSHHGIPYSIEKNLLLIRKINLFDCKTINSEDDGLPLSHYEEQVNSIDGFSINKNRFADAGFFINLDKSKDRLDNVTNQITEYNINGLIRFKALTDEMIHYSCTKSHLSVFKTAQHLNLNSIFVAEDDFQINETLFLGNDEKVNFFEKIDLLKKDLDSIRWDVFLFGCNPKDYLNPITNNLAVVNNSTGAWAYVIKKRAYEYLLENIHYKRDYIAIDDYLPLLNSKGFVTVTAIPLTMGHAVGYVSTLQPRGPVNYTEWIMGSYQKFLYDSYPNNNFIY
jgi:hypothetical protein